VKDTTRKFLLGFLFGHLLCAVILTPFLLIYARSAEFALASSAANRESLDACTVKLGHATNRLAAFEGWTFVYDRQERQEVQVLYGLGQIGIGSAVPENMVLRWAIPAHIPVLINGEAKGAHFVYYDPTTKQVSGAYNPMQFQPAGLGN
jgi:hypothetical protein